MDTQELHLLHQEGASIRELSRRTGHSAATIRRWFDKAGLPIRSQSEATSLGNLARPRGIGSRGGKAKPQAGNPNKPSAYEYVEALRRRKAEIVRNWKQERGCASCGENDLAVLDLHHRDPAGKHSRLKRKSANGSRRTGGYYWRDLSYADLQAELEKCDVLCSNCHRKREWQANH